MAAEVDAEETHSWNFIAEKLLKKDLSHLEIGSNGFNEVFFHTCKLLIERYTVFNHRKLLYQSFKGDDKTVHTGGLD